MVESPKNSSKRVAAATSNPTFENLKVAGRNDTFLTRDSAALMSLTLDKGQNNLAAVMQHNSDQGSRFKKLNIAEIERRSHGIGSD